MPNIHAVTDKSWYANDIVMLDCDNGFADQFMTDDLSSREAIIRSTRRYFDRMFDGSKVTDMSFCIFQQISFVDCKSMDYAFRKSTYSLESWINREDPPGECYPRYKRESHKRYPDIYHAFEKLNIDWAQIAVDCCREKNVRPWLYFRMNDLHAVDQNDSLFHDSFYYKARENGWLIGNPVYGRPIGTSGHIKNVYDFSHPEVREWYLNYIEEIMLRYDVFGYELDFMRNIYCFDYLRAEPGYQEYMNGFIHSVRAILRKAEEVHGHHIKLLVRVGHTVEHNYVYGFDVKTWAKEGLVDALVAGCEEVVNSGVDIREWREAIGEDIALLIGYDGHIIRWMDAGAEHIYRTKLEHIKGLSAKYFNLGVNGLYFNNFYSPPKDPSEKNVETESYYSSGSCDFARDINREVSEQGLRTLVVTHEDIFPIGTTPYKPLPMSLFGKGNSGTDFEMNIGRIRPDEHVYLVVGYDKRDIDVKVTIDGKDFVEVKEIPVIFDKVTGHYYDDDRNLLKSPLLLRYEFDQIDLNGDFNVHFTDSAEEVNVVYLEVSVTPQSME